MQKIVCHDCVP